MTANIMISQSVSIIAVENFLAAVVIMLCVTFC